MTTGPTIEQRFWSKVDKAGPCWLWTAAKTSEGYGAFAITRRTQAKAHRFAYELVRGPIPEGLVLDHVCRIRSCVNPDHLEPVTLAENLRRGISPFATNWRRTVCKNGHPFTAENTYIRPSSGRRTCRTCAIVQKQQRRVNARKEAA